MKRARFVVIKANLIPAILVEGGFVSNRMESARVNAPGYRQALAQCIARGLIKFANIMGGRHMSLPGGTDPVPRAQPVPVPIGTNSPPRSRFTCDRCDGKNPIKRGFQHEQEGQEEKQAGEIH